MAPVFAARDAKWLPQVEIVGPSCARLEEIQFRVKGRGPGVPPVILMVNTSNDTATIRVTAPTFAGATVHCWHEADRLQADGAGAFVDRLDANDVRVYATVSREAWLLAQPDRGEPGSAVPRKTGPACR